MNLARKIEIRPADQEASRARVGETDATLVLALEGEDGVVALEIGTGWFLPNALRGIEALDVSEFPEALAGYHSPRPLAGDVRHVPSCPLLGGAPCWGLGSSIAGRDLMRRLLLNGDSAIWPLLHELYVAAFEQASGPAYLDRLMERGRTIRY